jgi:hypothetical protein
MQRCWWVLYCNQARDGHACRRSKRRNISENKISLNNTFMPMEWVLYLYSDTSVNTWAGAAGNAVGSGYQTFDQSRQRCW